MGDGWGMGGGRGDRGGGEIKGSDSEQCRLHKNSFHVHQHFTMFQICWGDLNFIANR